MLKKKSLLIISAVALLGLLLSGCSADTANGKIKYDHVAMPEETDPYYIIGFADYVFIGNTLSDGIPVTLPSGNKRLEYDICVSECLKGNLVKEITAVYPAYYENDGTLVLMEGDTMKCRCGYFKKGQEFIVEDLCPPLCHELWNNIYPSVYALQNGASLDYGEGRAKVFDAKCPDEGRVCIHGEVIDQQIPV